MEYKKEFDVRDFQFWGGGLQWYIEFDKAGKLDILAEQIESVFDGETPTETDINDFVWFDDELHSLLYGGECE